jgi:hypothetical protein
MVPKAVEQALIRKFTELGDNHPVVLTQSTRD